ncbi:lipase class 3 [Nitzschia inconspicua]|uniref:Lipase class 3 n=1 Tax=Nitzschia inconspicua TaxID=303405 RepID=A0A9K3KMA6_9STRA|nr:lipase class 3 [Nitzschia inconspicua]
MLLFFLVVNCQNGLYDQGCQGVLGFTPFRSTAVSISFKRNCKLPKIRTSALTTTTTTNSGLFQSISIGTTIDSNNNDKKKPIQSNDEIDRGTVPISKRILVGRVLLFLGVFFGGYRIGMQRAGSILVDGAVKTVQKTSSSSRFPLVAWILALVLVRDFWRIIPAWLKPKLFLRASSDIQVLLGIKTQQQATAELAAAAAAKSKDSSDDLSDFTTLFGKLGTIQSVLQSRLPYDEDGKPSFNLRASFFELLKLTREIKAARIGKRDEFYQNSGQPATLEDMDQLEELMEYADWAYDEADKPLKELLEDKGYILLKHDKTTVPGYLGHYVAIPRDKSNKTALIGVKGTSGLEDMITDMCGAAVDVQLERPYYKYGDEKTATNLRAHEGIMIGTRRLADDLQPFVENLLLPQGYKIVVVGHSLGAAAAALLGVLLRSKIPDLQEGDTEEGPSNKWMQIYAFASPPSLDLDNALNTMPFVTTVVNNCDIITRCNVSPLSATVDVLKVVNDKVESTKELQKKVKRNWKFWKNDPKEAAEQVVEEDPEGDIPPSQQLLSDADELMKAVANATEAVTKNDDKDHLYVPGRVILMYDEWSQHSNETVDDKAKTTDEAPAEEEQYANHVADRAVVCNGTAQPLQYIEFDSRLLEDHMTEDYKSSIRKVTSALQKNSTMSSNNT